MAEEHHPPGLPGALGEQFQVTAALTGAVGVLRYAVVDAAQTPLLLELAERATLFDDPLSAFHGAAALCFGPTVPPTPIAAAARALYRMHHPTIPRPRGVGTVDLRPWIITGRPSGQLLAERDGPWPPGELHALAVALFEALGHAHARGVIHRAVGIENVCWGPGGLGLVGWTAAAVDGAPPPDSEIAPRRRAPESWLGAAPTVAVDLYAAGVLLHRLAAGRPPFAEASAAWDHVHVAPPALPPSTPPSIAALCARLLAKDPARRPESARAALDLLLRAPVEVQGPFASAPTATAASPTGAAPTATAAAPTATAAAPTATAAAPTAAAHEASDGATRRPGLALRALGAAPIGDDTLSSLPAMPALLLPPRPAPDPSVDAPPADAPPADQSPAAEPPARRAARPAAVTAPVEAAPPDDDGDESVTDASLEAALDAVLTEVDFEPLPAAAPGEPAPDAPQIPDDPAGAARHLLACGRPEEALRRCVDAERARVTGLDARVELRVLAGRALLARGETQRAFDAFDLALHAGHGLAPPLLAELADAAVEAGRIGVAVDAGLRAVIADVAAGRALLTRVVGRVLLRRADPPIAAEMLPVAVACTHLALRAVEDGDDGGPWFARGREAGQAGLLALDGPLAPAFPLHLALCAWGVGDRRAAEGAVRLAREHGLRVPQTVAHIGAEVCLKLALLTTHQRDRARALPEPLATWAQAIDGSRAPA